MSTISSFGGVPLVDDTYVCGTAFELSTKATDTASVTLDDGWNIETVAGLKLVVAKSASHIETSKLVDAALDAAHRGLDILSITGRGDKRIDDGHNSNMSWRRPDKRLKVTIRTISHMSTRVGPITISQYSPTGELIPQPPPKQPVWRDSYRFFRYAQTTDNIADAYRSMFLAVESALSSAVPPMDSKHRSPWRWFLAKIGIRTPAGEGEEAWLLRALRTVEKDGVDLQRVCGKSATNHPKWLVKHLYRDTRHSLFHAKLGRKVMLPTPPAAELTLLTERLKTLSVLYLTIIAHYEDVKRPGGGMFAGAFRDAQSKFVGNPVFLVDDDSPLDTRNNDISPAGKPIYRFGTSQPCPGVSDPFLITVATSGRWPQTPPIDTIRRVVFAKDEHTPLQVTLLEGELVLAPGTDLKIISGARVLNEQRHRYRFKT